jgi:hypothetical protein
VSDRPVWTAEDRSLTVPPGAKVITGYVPIHKIRMECRDRMAVGDVEIAFRRQLQLGQDQRWPPPTGHWDGDTFILVDGRHQYAASLLIGLEHLFVAWLEHPST